MRAFLALMLCLVAGSLSAHTRSVSHSFLTIEDDNASVRFVITALEMTRIGVLPDQPDLPGALADIGAVLTNAVQLFDAHGKCRSVSALPPERLAGEIIHQWRIECAGPPRGMVNTLFADTGIAHTHFASIRRDGGTPIAAILTPAQPRWQWTGAQAAPVSGIGAFFQLGTQHILSGWDHLTFLLVLLVAATSLREVLLLVTGFTIGHSVTLALAVLGIATPADAAIEAFIALSIIMVALDGAARATRTTRTDPESRIFVATVAGLLILLAAISPVMPWLVVAGILVFALSYGGLAMATHHADGWRLRLFLTCAFGLFHGFGFAGVLTEMSLPVEARVMALLGFNLGVEAGQLLVVALAWPMLHLMRRWRLPLLTAATSVAAGLGVYWYVTRLFG